MAEKEIHKLDAGKLAKFHAEDAERKKQEEALHAVEESKRKAEEAKARKKREDEEYQAAKQKKKEEEEAKRQADVEKIREAQAKALAQEKHHQPTPNVPASDASLKAIEEARKQEEQKKAFLQNKTAHLEAPDPTKVSPRSAPKTNVSVNDIKARLSQQG